MVPFGAMNRGYSVFMREGRAAWYVKFIDPDTLGWKSEATAFMISDPAGKRKATRFAEGKADEFRRMGKINRGQAWSHWVRDFLEGRYRGDQALTRTRYINAWDSLEVYLNEKRIRTPAELDYNGVFAYLAWRKDQKRSCGKKIQHNTCVTEIRILGVIVREAVRRGFAVANPVDRCGIKREEGAIKPELKAEEIALIRASVNKKESALPLRERWMTISFEIAMHQSVRLSETQVPLDRIDENKGVVVWHAKGRNGQKKIYPSALHPELVPLIRALRAAGATHTCHHPKMAAKLWWALRQEIGLEHTTFHSTRVTVISEMARRGVPQSQAMAFAGHSSWLVHQVYQRLVPPDLRQAVAAIQFGTNLSLPGATPSTAENPDAPSPMT